MITKPKIYSITILILMIILMTSGCSSKSKPDVTLTVSPLPSPSPTVSPNSGAKDNLMPPNGNLDRGYLIICTNLENEKLRNQDKFMETLIKKDFVKAEAYLKLNPVLVNNPDENFMTPLHYASEKKDNDIAEFLISHGAFINVKGRYGHPPLPLYIAALNKNNEMVKLLIENGADTEEPLARAIMERNIDSITTLLKNGAKFQESHLEMITYEKNYYILVNYPEDFRRISETQILNLFLNRSYWGGKQDPLHFLVRLQNYDVFCMKMQEKEIRNHRTRFRRHFQHEKIYEIMEKFAKKTSQINFPDSLGQTPLHIWASTPGDIKTAEILIKHGANINAREPHGDTPLHYAMTAFLGSNEAISYLLKNGAKKDAKNNNGKTPSDYARKGGHPERIKLLNKK